MFDANVLVSGFSATSGAVAELIERWQTEQFQLVVSESILAEVARAWKKPYWRARFSSEQVARAMTLVRFEAEVTDIAVQVTGVATHVEDDLVLAAAFSGQVDYLVTGDKGLLELGAYSGVTVLSPSAMLRTLETRGERRKP